MFGSLMHEWKDIVSAYPKRDSAYLTFTNAKPGLIFWQKPMRAFLLLVSICCCLCLLLSRCQGQVPAPVNKDSRVPDALIGGPFENSEYGLIGRPEQVMPIDTSPGWPQDGQRLKISGVVYKADGKTPVPGAVLYYYHTDVNGLYSFRPGLHPEAIRHGYIRGWVKSDERGRYTLFTVRPGAYPGRVEPAHIHLSVYEPGIPNPYYLDELVFDDAPLLTTRKRKEMRNRGGSGVLRLRPEGKVMVARHNVILGLNIPNHPHADDARSGPGPAIGEDLMSFTPFHAWGADAGTRVCPVCKYGKGRGAIFFIGSDYSPEALTDWLGFFETLAKSEADFHSFFVFEGGPDQRKSLNTLGKRSGLSAVALTVVPHFADELSEVHHYEFDRSSGNTLFLYQGSNVVDKYVDLEPSIAHREIVDRIIRSID